MVQQRVLQPHGIAPILSAAYACCGTRDALYQLKTNALGRVMRSSVLG